MSRVKPILFNTEMVREILDGRKTVTRRLVKQAHLRVLESEYHKEHPEVPDSVLIEKLCEPPYQPRDVMYVRETWRKWGGGYIYKADEKKLCHIWHPSIHMPKEATRIWLKVTNVRVERLQDINYFGCIDEGIPCRQYEQDIIKDFSELWDSTIKKSDLDRYGWEANPYVWRIAFERCEKPESEV